MTNPTKPTDPTSETLGNPLNAKTPHVPQTVTVQGFAWNSTTRTHSDKVLHEARNTIDAAAWIKRNEGKLNDLTILRTNETFLLHNLLIEHGGAAQ